VSAGARGCGPDESRALFAWACRGMEYTFIARGNGREHVNVLIVVS